MSNAVSLSNVAPYGASTAPAPGAPGNADGELAKCEGQLSDWVHCPSSKTAAGKAKIAEISGKIDALKAQIKKADEAKSVAKLGLATVGTAGVSPAGSVRLDGQGAWVNARA